MDCRGPSYSLKAVDASASMLVVLTDLAKRGGLEVGEVRISATKVGCAGSPDVEASDDTAMVRRP